MVERVELRDLLERWRDGVLAPADVISAARARWVAGDAQGADPIASDVLVILATAH
jgi:hypothetical protein